MAIKFPCQHCGAVYRLPDRLAGKQVRCKHCREVSAVPAVVSVAAAEVQSPPAAPEPPQRPQPIEPATQVGAEEPLSTPASEMHEALAGTDASVSEHAEVAVAPVSDTQDAGAGVPDQAGQSRWTLVIVVAAVAALGIAGGAYFWPKLRKPTPQPAAITPSPKAPAARHRAADIAARDPSYLQCAENMRKLAAAAFDYAERHGGRFPYDLSEMAVDRRDGFKAVPAECFFCPSSGTKVPPNMKPGELANWLHKHTDYVWVAHGADLQHVPPILLHEKPVGKSDEAINYVDDQRQVRIASLEQLQQAMKQQRGMPNGE
jgi:hypothetical protein